MRGKGQWRDDIDGGGKSDSNVCNKTQVIQNNHQTLGFDSPSLQAPKCLFQHPEVLAGGSPTKKSRQRNIHKLFLNSHQNPPVKDQRQAKKGSYTPLQAREKSSEEARGQFPRAASDGVAVFPIREKEITWYGSQDTHMAESSETQMADSFDTESFHGPPSLNRGSRYRKTMATKVAKLTDQLNNQEKIAEAAIAMADSLHNSQEGEPSSGDT